MKTAVLLVTQCQFTMPVFRTLLALLVFMMSTAVAKAEQTRTLNLWADNFASDANIALISLALEKAKPKYGAIALKRVAVDSYSAAFSKLENNTADFDAVISALDKDREAQFLPVFFPLDRGLLGFRLCIISPDAESNFEKITSLHDFHDLNLSVTLSPDWTDMQIMKNNDIPVIEIKAHRQRLQLARQDNSVCYSRSIIEIENELRDVPDLIIEQSFVMLYPLAEILYFRKGADDLARALEYGLKKAYQDGSFSILFDQYYHDLRQHHGLYSRKLLITPSPLLSEQGRHAINRYGLVSFIPNPKR